VAAAGKSSLKPVRPCIAEFLPSSLPFLQLQTFFVKEIKLKNIKEIYSRLILSTGFYSADFSIQEKTIKRDRASLVFFSD